MTNPRLLAGFVVLVLGTAIHAAGPVPNLPEVFAFNELLSQLGERDSADRDRAERKLASLGKPVLPYLRKAVRHADPEVRRRVVRILPAMEHYVLVAPRRFSLKVTNQPLNGVLEAMRKATGYRIDNNAGMVWGRPAAGKPATEAKMTYDFKDATFWEIADRVCRDFSLTVQGNWGDDVLRFQSAGNSPLHTGISGSFRYAATNFQLYRNVDLNTPEGGGPPAKTETLTFNFLLNAEPRLPFLGNDQPNVEAAYDDLKSSMLPAALGDDVMMPNPWGGRFISRRMGGGGYKQLTMTVSVPLAKASDKARTMKLLKGTVPVTLLVEQKAVVVTKDLMKAAKLKKDVEGIEFLIHEVKTMPANQYQVRMTVTNSGNPTDFTWMNTFYQRVELFDAAGTKFQNYGSSWGGGAGVAKVELTMTFGHFGGAKIGPPKKLQYQHWVTRTHDIPFEFRDVQLP